MDTEAEAEDMGPASIETPHSFYSIRGTTPRHFANFVTMSSYNEYVVTFEDLVREDAGLDEMMHSQVELEEYGVSVFPKASGDDGSYVEDDVIYFWLVPLGPEHLFVVAHCWTPDEYNYFKTWLASMETIYGSSCVEVYNIGWELLAPPRTHRKGGRQRYNVDEEARRRYAAGETIDAILPEWKQQSDEDNPNRFSSGGSTPREILRGILRRRSLPLEEQDRQD